MNPDSPKADDDGAGAAVAAFALLLSRLLASTPPSERDALPEAEKPVDAEAETDAMNASEESVAQTPDPEQLMDTNALNPSSGIPCSYLQPTISAAQVADSADVPSIVASLPGMVAPSAPAPAAQTPGPAQSMNANALDPSSGASGPGLQPTIDVVQSVDAANEPPLDALPSTAAEGKAGARIADSIAEAGKNENGAAVRELPEAENAASGKEIKPGERGSEDENAPKSSNDSKESGRSLPRGAALTEQNDGDDRPSKTLHPARSDASNRTGNPVASQGSEGLPQGGGGDARPAHGAQSVPAPAATDHTAMSLHEQSAPQAQAAHAVRGMDKAEVYPLLRPQSANSAELPDHTFSIVREGNRLTVQIEPGGLGKIDINLSLEQGFVNGRIHVADAATRNLIENNIQQILDALQKEGVSVGGLSVGLKQNGTWDGKNGDKQDDARDSTGAAPQAAGCADQTAIRGRINIFI